MAAVDRLRFEKVKHPQKGPVVLRDAAPSDASAFAAIDGESLDTEITVLFFATEEVGAGASWHVHPYDEVFLIRAGRARFKVGSETIDVAAGDVLMAPAAVPHRFSNLGPDRFETIDLHLSPRWIQTDLDDPDDGDTDAG